MANLSLKHIYKVYPNGTKAVNDFNMQIEDKEFIVFVGPSGCGKSTTLRMIAGLENISSGELKIGDTVVNGIEPKDRDIAMVFQNYALYPHMTIFENLAFGLQTRKIPDIKRDKDGNPVLDANGRQIECMRRYTKQEIKEKVEEAAEILGITDYLKRKPKEMSGGQRQRVALGRAIVRNPKVMLLDEPLSNLDAKLRTQMRSEIVKLHRKLNTTFIYVTHDQVEAMTMGTRIVVMKLGEVQQIDTPKNLYKYPENKFVAGFIGTPQMNFFEGTLKKDGENVHIDFACSDAKVTVPYSMMMKTTPQYLDGSKTVYVGLRAEDISLEPEVVKKSGAVIKVKVSHTEALGTETLVYADINMNGDGFGDTATRVVIKSAGFRDFAAGEVLDAALDINAVHLFDKDTEKSILPRIPEYNYLDCKVTESGLSFLNTEIELPPAVKCGTGAGELLIPVSAITFDGGIEAKIVGSENVSGKNLLWLDVGGKRIFVISDTPSDAGTVKIGIDFKQIIIRMNGETAVEPMPCVNRLNGSFAMEKETDTVTKKKMQKYFAVIGNEKFVCPEEVADKMLGAFSGRKVFNTEFRYEWSPYGFTIGETGITASVLDTADYGREKFVKCAAYGETLYVYTDKPVSGEIKLTPDLSKVSVVEAEREIRIV